MARARQLLTREDWIRAGQMLLREGGAPSVKLATLAKRLGVTSGSFYHHFRDFTEYLNALADFYGTDNVRTVLEALTAHDDPRDRLRTLWEMAQEQDILKLDSAMRVWATTSERARLAVALLDSGFLEVIREAFREIGFTAEEARLRALLAFSAGVGLPLIFGQTMQRDDDPLNALLVLMAGAPAPPDQD